MKNFALGVLTTAAIAAAAYYVSNIDHQAVALLAINNAIGLLYNLEAILLAA
jgi:hypothetical protein